jgi:hypothetical protein
MTPDEATLEAYRQAFEMVRHSTNLRYTVLTAFVVISGGLFTLVLSRRARPWQAAEVLIPGATGIVVAIAFGCAEWRINEDFGFYSRQTVKLGKLLPMPEEALARPQQGELWENFGKGLTLVIYGGAIVIWLIAIRVFWERGHATRQGGANPEPNQPRGLQR